MQDSRTLSTQIQHLLDLTGVISTLLFMYLQVREYSYFHFFARRMSMHLSFASASTLRRMSTEAKKGVRCRRSLIQVWWYFFFLYHLEVYRHFSGVLYW